MIGIGDCRSITDSVRAQENHDKIRRLRYAFTLVEVLVGLAIIVPVVVFGSQMLVQGIDVWEVLTCRSDLQAAGQRVLNQLTEELRSATRSAATVPPRAVVTTPQPNNTVRFYLPQDIGGNGTIVDALGETEWGPALIVYQRNAAANSLERVEGGTARVMTIHVAEVNFDDVTTDASLGNTEIRIALRLERRTPTRQRLVQENFVRRVKLRN